MPDYEGGWGGSHYNYYNYYNYIRRRVLLIFFSEIRGRGHNFFTHKLELFILLVILTVLPLTELCAHIKMKASDRSGLSLCSAP